MKRLAPWLLAVAALGAACQPVAPPQAALTAPGGSVPIGALVTLDGAASTAAQGRVLAFSWRLAARPAGSTAVLEGADRPASFFRPDVEGAFLVSLVVSDGSLTATAEATVTAACGVAAPELTVGAPPPPGRVGAPVSFSATATDPDEAAPCGVDGAAALAWRFVSLPAGSHAALKGDRGSAPWFVPDVPGDYRAEVTATDATGRSARAEVQAEVGACGTRPPVIEAIAATPAAVGSPVRLSANVSDPDLAAGCEGPLPLAFSWRLSSRPAGSLAALDDASREAPSFVPDQPGRYRVELAVTDTAGLRALRSLDVTADGCGGNSPALAAVVALPAAPGAGQAVSLSAALTDADNAACQGAQTFAWTWSLDALPAGSRAQLNDAAAARPWFLADLPGLYRVSVHALDSTGRESARQALALDVASCGGAAPVATITAPASVGLGVAVPLTAVVTDADAVAPCSRDEAASYRWSLTALPPGSAARLNDAALANPSLVPDVAGRYSVRLVAYDRAGHASAPALATVEAGVCGGRAPVAAIAGPAAATAGQPVSFTASATDPDTEAGCARDGAASFLWALERLPAGSRAVLGDLTAASPTLTPDLPGSYVVRVVAIDASGLESAPAQATLTVSSCGSSAPTITAAASPATARVGERVSLTAAGADADAQAPCALGGELSYRWSLVRLPAGSAARVEAANTPVASLVPDVAGSYLATATVTDPTGRTARADVALTVSACGGNRPGATVAVSPVALAAGMAARLVPTVVDADLEAACLALATPAQSFAYAWSVLAVPAGSAARLSSPEAASPGFAADSAGDYVFRLVVTDSTGRASDPVTKTVTVSACGASAPADVTPAASTQTPVAGETVALTGTFTDPDALDACRALLGAPGASTFRWRVLMAPGASRATLAGADRQDAGFTPDLPGTYRLSLAVTDATGRTGTGTVDLEVGTCGTSSPTVAPTVDASSRLVVGGAVKLAAGADDPDAACGRAPGFTYHWVLARSPAGSRAWLAAPSAAAPSFVPDVAGSYQAEVTVLDATGRQGGPATVTFAVAPCGGNPPVARVKVTSPAVSATAAAASVTVSPLLSCRVQFDARDSADADADAACGLAPGLRYAWKELAAPEGSLALLSPGIAATPWFAPDTGGTFDFEVGVSDGALESLPPATVRIVHGGFRISAVAPAVACVGATPASLTLTAAGQRFLWLKNPSTFPSVLFGGAAAPVTGLSGCESSGVTGIDSCTTMVITIPSSRGQGDYPILVQNPVQDGCLAANVFSVGPSPSITTVAPTQVCGADDPLKPDAFNLNIRGSGFVAATQPSLSNGTPGTSVQLRSATELDTVFAIPPPGTYGVTVSNGSGCAATKANALTVLAVPLVFFVDPPVLYNGISTQVTAYVSGLNGGSVTGVQIRRAGSAGNFTPVAFTWDVARPNQVQAVIPSGLASGTYETIVTDGETCTSIPVQTFQVTGALTLALGAIDPPFGWRSASTSVDLRTTSPLPAGMVAFSNIVRVYLNPVGGTGVASALRSVSVVNANLANALVPAGLPVGLYDVIAVNSDGAVGLLAGGFRASLNPPPVVDSITPGSIPSNSPQAVVVRGTGFSSPTLALDCLDAAGALTRRSVTVSGVGPTQLTAAVPGLTIGTACVFEVTNQDGTRGEFSALGVTGPSENLPDFKAATSMTVARRALAAASGRPTRTARFLYAVGGDGGTTAGALATVEAAPVDRFGSLGTWRSVPRDLPGKRTFSVAQTVGRFLYVVGGDSGAGPLTSVVRAEILDPARAPEINDLFLELNAAGVMAGVWSYRVAAVLAAGDAANPGGEALASDRLTVQVPAGLPNKLRATLSWTTVTGAASYRVYRSPAAGQEKLVGTVMAPATSFVDTGVEAGSAVPLQVGDLGAWATMPSLNVARSGLGLGFAVDPSDATKRYLYAISGRTTGAAVDRTYEYLPITLGAGGAQTVGTWTRVTTNNLGAGRWQTFAFNVNDTVTTRIAAGDTWIHLGPGRNAADSGFVSDVDAARATEGGPLTTWFAEPATNNRAGYGAAAAANQLFIFGGGSSPSTGCVSAPLCGLGGPCGGPPDLKNWTAGCQISVARLLMGSTVESARIFIVGGETTGGVTATVESVIW